jgi:hypothetical protein
MRGHWECPRKATQTCLLDLINKEITMNSETLMERYSPKSLIDMTFANTATQADINSFAAGGINSDLILVQIFELLFVFMLQIINLSKIYRKWKFKKFEFSFNHFANEYWLLNIINHNKIFTR